MKGGEGVLAGDDPRATIGTPTQFQSDRCLVPPHLPRTTNEREPGAEEDTLADPVRRCSRSARLTGARMRRWRAVTALGAREAEIGRARLYGPYDERYVLVELDAQLTRAIHHVFPTHAPRESLVFHFLAH